MSIMYCIINMFDAFARIQINDEEEDSFMINLENLTDLIPTAIENNVGKICLVGCNVKYLEGLAEQLNNDKNIEIEVLKNGK